MSTAIFAPEPLYVIDNTSIAKDGPRKGRLIGTFDILNKPSPEEGHKWIGDTKPYGDGFPNYDEAKAYAKLFAAAPELLAVVSEALDFIKAHNHYAATGIIDKLQSAIEKATT